MEEGGGREEGEEEMVVGVNEYYRFKARVVFTCL